MNKDSNPGQLMQSAWGNITSGNPLFGFFGVLVLATFLYSGVAFYDGLNGRGCGGPTFDDVFSWGKGLGCFSRGILENSPRAKTQQKPRPN